MEVKEETQNARAFRVVCVWCGAEVRRGDTPQPEGMCQGCFRRMIEEHTRTAERGQALYASER